MTNERTEVEKESRYLIAGDISYRVLESLGKRGTRRLEKAAKNIETLLKDSEEKGNSVDVRISKIEEEEKARTVNEGINEFYKQFPEQGSILKGLIEEKRAKKNKYLVYKLNENYKLGEEEYVRVMMDIGFDRREANSVYPHILAISERLKKADEKKERTILL